MTSQTKTNSYNPPQSVLMLSFTALFLLYPLDATNLSLSLFVPNPIPFGFAGMMLVIVLIVFGTYYSNRQDLLNNAPAILLLALTGLLFATASISDYFSGLEAWNWTKMFLEAALGYWGCTSIRALQGLPTPTRVALISLISANGIFWLIQSNKGYTYVDNPLNYLRVGDAVVLMGLLCINYATPTRQWGVLILTAVSLYFIGSRFCFFGFIAASLTHILLGMKLKHKALTLTVILIAVALLYLYLLHQNISINDSRFTRLIFYTEYDTSLNRRNEVNAYGLEQFLAHPWLGAGYAFYLSVGRGLYAHNILSVIYEFGMLGLLWIVVATLLMIQSIQAEKRHQLPTYRLVSALYAFVFIGAISRYYNWGLYWFAIGAAISTLAATHPASRGSK